MTPPPVKQQPRRSMQSSSCEKHTEKKQNNIKELIFSLDQELISYRIIAHPQESKIGRESRAPTAESDREHFQFCGAFSGLLVHLKCSLPRTPPPLSASGLWSAPRPRRQIPGCAHEPFLITL